MLYFTHKEKTAVGLLLISLVVGSVTLTLKRDGANPVVQPQTGLSMEGIGSPADGTERMTSVAEKPKAIPVTLLVHVGGAVAHPGVYTLQDGARVMDAIKEAGGGVAGADLDALNLAARVSDGEKVSVPAVGAPAAPSSPVGMSRTGGMIDVNTASAIELEDLPGVGPALAARIVEYRQRAGRFKSFDGLDSVPGIGPKMMERLKTAAVVH